MDINERPSVLEIRFAEELSLMEFMNELEVSSLHERSSANEESLSLINEQRKTEGNAQNNSIILMQAASNAVSVAVLKAKSKSDG